MLAWHYSVKNFFSLPLTDYSPTPLTYPFGFIQCNFALLARCKVYLVNPSGNIFVRLTSK